MAAAATAQAPGTMVVAVLAKVFEAMAAGAGAAATPTGASLIRLQPTFAAKQTNSTPAVMLEKM